MLFKALGNEPINGLAYLPATGCRPAGDGSCRIERPFEFRIGVVPQLPGPR